MAGDPLEKQANRHSGPEHGIAKCVSVDQAMETLAIGRTKLYQLIAAGEIETIHIGRRTLVLRASIDDLIERLRRANSSS